MAKKWVLTLVILIVGVSYFWGGRSAPPIEITYEQTLASRRTLNRTVVATGVIRPVVGAEINVGSRVSGIVANLPVKVGDVVQAGDLLGELDPTELKARVAQSRAELALAQARLALAESSFQRIKNLAAQRVASPQDLDIARRDLAVAKAQIDLNQARLHSAEIDLGYTRITAPIAGVIAKVTTREGETVAASFAAPNFVTLIDPDRLEVQVFVDETDIGRVFVGQKAQFSVDTYPDISFSATVTAIEPKAEIQNSVVNYVVILDFEKRDDATLRTEMTTHVRLVLESRPDVLTVPRDVLRRRDGQAYVVVQRDSVWVEQVVKLGWRTDNNAEILSGLNAGETVQRNTPGR